MIHLTHQERKVLLFLSLLFAAGVLLSVFKKTSGCNICFVDLYSRKAGPGVVDINQADREELIALPGIGEKTADEIIAYRASRGGFKDLAELKEIKGISDAKLNSLKKYLSIK